MQTLTEARIEQLREVLDYFNQKFKENIPTAEYNKLLSFSTTIRGVIHLLKSQQDQIITKSEAIRKLQKENNAFRDGEYSEFIKEEREIIIAQLISRLEDLK